MAKRLLTKDFQNIVFETLSMPETDFYNYYLNTVEEHHSQNPNITAQIIEVLKSWIKWHKSKVYGGTIQVQNEQGTTDTIDINQVWDIDENGQRVYSNLDETAVSLLHECDVNRQVNRAFFDNQIRILETIQSTIELKLKVEAFENVAGNPKGTANEKGFDFNEIKQRAERITKTQRFLIDEKDLITSPQYDYCKRTIKEIGYLAIGHNGIIAKVYRPELMAFFTSNEIPAKNLESNESAVISPKAYLTDYVNGFADGEAYFDSEYKANASTLYGANSEQYIKDLHQNYWHVQHKAGHFGWRFVLKSYPLIITKEIIKEYGYYAGIVSKVQELSIKHPQLFDAFEKCEHQMEQPEPHPTANGKAELSINEIALKCVYENIQITRKNGKEIAKQYGYNSGEKLFQRFCFYSSTANRKAKPDLCTPKKLKNKIELFERVINLLPIDMQGRAKDELKILKTIYETEYQ